MEMEDVQEIDGPNAGTQHHDCLWSDWDCGIALICVCMCVSCVRVCVVGSSRQYEVWFSLEVACSPAPPTKVVVVQCAVQSCVTVEISVSNPQAESLLLGVCLEGEDLSGDSQVCLPAAGSLTYKATYSPARVGHRTGRYTHTHNQ